MKIVSLFENSFKTLFAQFILQYNPRRLLTEVLLFQLAENSRGAGNNSQGWALRHSARSHDLRCAGDQSGGSSPGCPGASKPGTPAQSKDTCIGFPLPCIHSPRVKPPRPAASATSSGSGTDRSCSLKDPARPPSLTARRRDWERDTATTDSNTGLRDRRAGFSVGLLVCGFAWQSR